MSTPLDLSLYARPYESGTVGLELAVEGVACGNCIARIENAVKGLPGVTEARLNFTNRRLRVAWNDKTPPPGIIDALEKIGYRGHPFQPLRAEQEEAREAKRLTRCLGVAGFAAMNVMLLSVSVWSGNVTDITPETRDFFHWASALIALPAAAYAGQPFFQSAWRALRARSVNMDVPISLGVVLALGMSVVETANHAEHAYFDSALMLLFFLLVGRALDHAMRRKTRAVAGNLAAIKAETASQLRNDEVVQVPAAALRANDRILVRPGERVPADGVVLGGCSEIDESLVTGETAHRHVAGGDAIYAGSMNYSGALTLRVTAAGSATLIDEIERLLEKAIAARPRMRRLADRAARFYAPVVHATAVLTAAGWLMSGASLHNSIITAIAVLVITCPCALALAIPAVQVVASSALFRAGVIINSGDAVERLAEVDTIVFDKTGTLTLPEPCIVNSEGVDPALLEMAARLALSSRHPLALTLAKAAKGRAPYEGVTEEPGQGISVMIGGETARLGSAAFCGLEAIEGAADASAIAFAYAGRSAIFLIRQALRPDAVSAVAALRARGFDIQVLSGDRPEAVAPVAAALGIRQGLGGLKPAEKIAIIEALKAQGRRVLMVGDGINDAPALAAAHVSLSPITAADLTQGQADAVFLGDRLMPVVEAIAIARRSRRLMKQNLWLAACYNAVAVPIAIAGLVTPLIAALAMSGSSMLVTLNALRAGKGGAER